MPFLSIFRKDVPKSPIPTSPAASKKSSSFSRARSRPSFTSSRAISPPPQLADVSPQSDFDYVLPELDEFPVTETPSAKRRGFGRRTGSAMALPVTSPVKSPPRPFSEALDTFMTQADKARDGDRELAPKISNSGDSDDEPLVPPPPRASVFAGFSYDKDRPRSQSLPDDTDRPRPVRPQVHPHQLREKKQGASSDIPPARSPTPDMAKSKRPSDAGKGLFSWRSKSAKPVPPVVAADPDSSFSLKSFRHVGPSVPVSPSDAGSTTNLARTDTPPSSFSRSTSTVPTTATARPIPGRSTPTTRERVSSVGSEGMMPAGLFRQAARRSSTNLVEDTIEKPRIRDNERRGPPTRAWDTRDDGASSGSERPQSDRSTRVGRSSSAIPYVGRKSMALADDDDSTPESPSPFAGRLSESPFGTRSDYGHGPRIDTSMYGSRSDGGARSRPRPSSPAKLASPTKPSVLSNSSVLSSSPPRLSLGFSSPEPPARSNSPTKPRHSAPAPRPTRSPVRTTIPTKTNDGPSIKPTRPGPGHGRQTSGDTLRNGHGRRPSQQPLIQLDQPTQGHHREPSGETSVRSMTVDVNVHARRPSGFEVVSRPKSPAPSSALHSHSRSGTVDMSSSSVDLSGSRPKTPVGDRDRAKSPVPTVASRAKSPAPTVASRAKSPTMNARPGPQPTRPGPQPTRSGPQPSNTRPGQSRGGYVPPPRQSSLKPTIVDSDSDESPEETESGSDEFGYGAKQAEEKERVDGADSFGARVVPGAPGVGALRGKAGRRDEPSPLGKSPPSASPPSKEQGLSRERTITQRDRVDPPRIGVSLFDRPMPSSIDSFGPPPARTVGRTRASHSTSAISAAATARNSAAMADANRPRPSHTRAAAEGTDTDEDEEDEKSESESDDNAPLSSLAPARRPGSAASAAPSMVRTTPVAKPSPNVAKSTPTKPGPTASRPPVSRGMRTQPLVDMAGPSPARPPRRVPGVGVTRNSSLRGSRSVEDLGRIVPSGPGPRPSVPGPRPSASGPRPSVPGPRPFVYSPPSSTGDSSSGKAPLTPRDGSDAGAVRPTDEARRKQRRRSEAKASVDLANVINGPGPVDDDDDDESPHSQLGHGGMVAGGMGMGWNQPGFMPHGGFGFPASQSMPFLHPQLTGPATAMGFMPPPPPPGATEAYMAAHQQAMLIAKQTYLSAVAQQAMAAATEQWERSSNAGGSVYGGSQMSAMGMPMMGMYASSAYAASSYEPSVVGGWGSASAYGGQSVYGAGARSEYGGGMKTSPVKGQGHGRNRSRTQTTPSDVQNRANAVPPSTWATRRPKGGI